jgi:mono/diheme cytochrome c family protein
MTPIGTQIPRARAKLKRRCMLVLLGAMVSSAIGFGARNHKEENGPAAQLSKAPPSAEALTNPLAGQENAIAAGRKLFHKHCVECHGPDGHGLGHAADLRSPLIQNAPPGVLFWAIQNGNPRKGMPSWSSHLKDLELWQIITYIKTLNEAKGRQ